MRQLLVLAVFARAMSGCATGLDEQDARRALEKKQFSDIKLTGVTLMPCTGTGMGFEATNPWGVRNSGVVCGGGVWAPKGTGAPGSLLRMVTQREYEVEVCAVVQTVGGFTFAGYCTIIPFGGQVFLDD